MPLYEYQCEQCGKRTEVLQRFDADAPVCDDDGKKMVRQISRTNFSLRGDGWYRDGYGLRKPSKTSKE